LTPAEGQSIFDKIQENTPYTGVHDEPPEEESMEQALEISMPEETTISKSIEFLPDQHPARSQNLNLNPLWIHTTHIQIFLTTTMSCFMTSAMLPSNRSWKNK
jgi:hypothetical protein